MKYDFLDAYGQFSRNAIDQEARINNQLLAEFASFSAQWRKDANENYYMYHNELFDEEQKFRLRQMNIPAFSTNDFQKNVKLLYSMLSNNRVKVSFRKNKDSQDEIMDALNALVLLTLNDHRSEQARLSAMKELLLTGLGVIQVQPRHDAFGNFSVSLESLPSSSTLADPMTQTMDWSDAPVILNVKCLSRKQCEQDPVYSQMISDYDNYQSYIDAFVGSWRSEGLLRSFKDLESLPYDNYIRPLFSVSSSLDLNLSKERQVFVVIERYEKKKQSVFIVDDKRLDPKFPLFRKLFLDNAEERRTVEYFKKQGVHFYKKETFLVSKTVSVGRKAMTIDSPLLHYPIAPFHDEYRGNPYPISISTYLKVIQKRLTYTQIQNLATMKNLRTGQKYVDRNAVRNADEGGIETIVGQVQKQNAIIDFDVPKDKRIQDVVMDATIPPYPNELRQYELDLKLAMLDQAALKGIADFEENADSKDLFSMQRKKQLTSRSLAPIIENLKVGYRQLVKSIVENWTSFSPPNFQAFQADDEKRESVAINQLVPTPMGYETKNLIAFVDVEPIIDVFIDPLTDEAIKLDRLSFLAQSGAADAPELLASIVDIMRLSNAEEMKRSIRERYDLKPKLEEANSLIEKLKRENEALLYAAKEEKLNRQLEIRKQRANTQIQTEREIAKQEISSLIEATEQEMKNQLEINALRLKIDELQRAVQTLLQRQNLTRP